MPELTREDLARMLAPSIGIEKARSLVDLAASRVCGGGAVSVDAAHAILQRIVSEGGLVGMAARMAATRLRAQHAAADAARTPPMGTAVPKPRSSEGAPVGPAPAVAGFAAPPATPFPMQPGSPAAVTSTDGRPLALVVDDSVTSLRVFEGLMGRQGFAVTTCQNAEQALAAVLARVPDVIVLDVVMPDVDGFQLCRQLRALLPGPRRVPIVFLTGAMTKAGHAEVAAAGGDDLMRKPFDQVELASKLRALMKTAART